MTTPTNFPPTVFEPTRLARLSRGLLMTLRSLSSERGGDEWTGVSVSKKLAIQRFYSDFDAWIRELGALPATALTAVPEEGQCASDSSHTDEGDSIGF